MEFSSVVMRKVVIIIGCCFIPGVGFLMSKTRTEAKQKRLICERKIQFKDSVDEVSLGVGILMNKSVVQGKNKEFKLEDKIQFKIPKDQVKKVVLKNGMTVLAYQNKAIPKVLVQIAYDIGSAVEEQGERGLAHLLEHMIFKGTRVLAEGDIDAIARKYGAAFNAFTSKDVTSYYFESNKNNWKPFVSILADCMQNARFDDQHLASELLAVIAELKMCKDRFWSRMTEKASELAYPANHPYHFPIIGYKEDLADVTAEKIKKFYNKYYTPSHALLVIMGDIDLDDAIATATAQFEGIPGKESEDLSHRFPHIIPDLTAHKSRIYEVVSKEQLCFFWEVPGLKSGKKEVMQGLIDVLGGGEGSRLIKRLVDIEQIAHGMAVSSYEHAESGLFLILLEPKDGKAEACRRIVTEELEKLLKEGVTAEELNKHIVGEAVGFFHEMEHLQDFAYDWISSYFATRDEFEIFRKIENLYSINSESICAFAKQYIDPLFMHQIELLPLPEDKRAVWQAAKLQSEAVDQRILANHVRTTPVEEPQYVKTLPEPTPLEFVFPKVTDSITLENGLKVLFYKNDTLPLLSVHAQFRDASHFSSSIDGVFVDFMMGMLVEGSHGYSKDDHVDFFESRGIDYGFDATGAHLSLLAKDSAVALERFYTILTQPSFPKDAFKKQRENIMHSLLSGNDSPRAVAMRQLKNILYKNSAYDWTFDQAIELVKKEKISDMEKAHKKHVSPTHMILSITGSFDLESMKTVIKTIFSDWKASEYVSPSVTMENFVPGTQVDSLMLRDQAVLVFGQPSPLNVYNQDLPLVKMLNMIAFGSLGSRLYELRERTGLFYTAQGSWANGAEKEFGYDFLFAMLDADKLNYAETEIHKTIETFKTKGVYEHEVNAARQMYLNGLIDMTGNMGALSSMFARMELLGLEPEYYDVILKRIQSVSVADLNLIAKKYFDTSKMARIRVGRVEGLVE